MAGVTAEVRLMRAIHVKPMNKNKGYSDVYAKIQLARTEEIHKTSVCYNTTKPRWYESMKFSNVLETDEIIVELWDKSMLKNNKLIGSTIIPVSFGLKNFNPNSLNAKAQRELAKWYSLDNNNGRFSILIVTCDPNNPSNCLKKAREFFQFVNRKYRPRVESSMITRVAKEAVDIFSSVTKQIHPVFDLSLPVEHQLTPHSTYTIKLDHVDEIFENKKQGWARDYSAAKRIFSGSMSGTLKTALVAQHDLFYGKLGKGTGMDSVRKDLAQVNGSILDVNDLLEIINYGKRDGKSRLFTYVIIENEWRFCETGANFQQDMDSKHAMHSRASPFVVYAGEFFVKGKILVIDNSSGTYAPNPELLLKVKKLLEENFFGIQVEVYDYESEILAKYKKDCI